MCSIINMEGAEGGRPSEAEKYDQGESLVDIRQRYTGTRMVGAWYAQIAFQFIHFWPRSQGYMHS